MCGPTCSENPRALEKKPDHLEALYLAGLGLAAAGWLMLGRVRERG